MITSVTTSQNRGGKKKKKRYHVDTIPTTPAQHFFSKYLFILENKVWHFQISFFRISTVEE